VRGAAHYGRLGSRSPVAPTPVPARTEDKAAAHVVYCGPVLSVLHMTLGAKV